MCIFFSLGNLGIPFPVSQKATKESPAPKLAFSFSLLIFLYLLLLLFSCMYVEEPKEPLTLIWNAFDLWESLKPILKESNKVFKIT